MNDAHDLTPEDALTLAMAKRLIAEFPLMEDWLNSKAGRVEVADGISTGRQIGAQSSALLYRFLRLRYLDATSWARPGAAEVALATLIDESSPFEARLAFIECAVLGRN